MVEKSGEAYDYEAEPRVHQKVYSALTRTLGGVMDSRVATYGALQVLKSSARTKRSSSKAWSNTASARRFSSSTII
jgi:hypothetical protein